jgi:phage-related minor tail protein
LTSAQYAQIEALEAEGKARDAARLAESAYTSAMNDRAKEVEDNAGWIIESAHFVRDAWNEAWGAVKGIGKPDSLADKVATVQAQIKALTTPHLDRAGNLVQAGGSDELQRLQEELNSLRRQQVQAGLKMVDDQLSARANEDAIHA